jgi:CheY-like chemotaxis protein
MESQTAQKRTSERWQRRFSHKESQHLEIEAHLVFQDILTEEVKVSLQTCYHGAITIGLRSGFSILELSRKSGQSCILVVDDHDQVRCLLKEWLETVFPDFGVVEAKSGEEAVAVAQAKLPKLVIMDIGLPEMDGIRAAQLIKESVPTAKVVVLTMHEEEQYQKSAFASGVSAYIPKRSMQRDLLPALQHLLALGGSGASSLGY